MGQKPSDEGERLRVLCVGETSPDRQMAPERDGAPLVEWRSVPGEREALEFLENRTVEVVILRASGASRGYARLLRTLRTRGCLETPLVFLLAGEGDRVFPSLRAGADLCVSWGGSCLDFFETLRSLYWRFSCRFPLAMAFPERPETVSSSLVLDPQTRCVHHRGNWISLTPIEYRILETLMRTPGVPLEARALMRQVWGYQVGRSDPPLRWHVKNLRLKLEEDPTRPRILRTLPRKGYAVLCPSEEPPGSVRRSLPDGAREVLEAIAEGAADAFVVADEEWRVVLWNREAERVFGYRREEVLGRDLRNALFPKHRDGDLWRLWEERTRREEEGFGEARRVAVEARPRTGTPCRLDMTQSGFTLWGERYRLAVFRPEDRNRKVLDPEGCSPSLSVAEHEIRHLAQAILGFSQLALASQTQGGQRKHVERVSRAAQSLRTLLGDLPLLSRIRVWDSDPGARFFSPRELLDRLSLEARKSLRREGRFLRIHVREETGFSRLRGDPDRLYRILCPLLEEALRCADEEGVDLVARCSGVVGENPELRFEVCGREKGASPGREGAPDRLALALPEGELCLERHPDGERRRIFVLRDGADLQDRALPRRWPELEGRRILVVSGKGRTRRHLESLIASWGGRVRSVSRLEEGVVDGEAGDFAEDPEAVVLDEGSAGDGPLPEGIPVLLLSGPDAVLPEGPDGPSILRIDLESALRPERFRETLRELLGSGEAVSIPSSVGLSGDWAALREALRFQQPRRCRENLEALRGDPGIRARQGLLNRVEALVSDYRFDEALWCLGEDA